MTGFAGTGDRVEFPGLAPGARVIGGDESANAELSTGNAHDHLVLDDKRRNGHRISGVRIRNRGIPKRTAGLGIERNEVRVERRQEQRVTEHREAVVHGPAAGLHILRRKVSVDPEHPSRPGVERHGVTRGLRDVHDSIGHQWRGLELFQRLRLKDPLLLEGLDVCRIDLTQQAVALAGIAAGIAQPVLRLLRRTEQALVRNLRT